jgi:hypothetical protein
VVRRVVRSIRFAIRWRKAATARIALWASCWLDEELEEEDEEGKRCCWSTSFATSSWTFNEKLNLKKTSQKIKFKETINLKKIFKKKIKETIN